MIRSLIAVACLTIVWPQGTADEELLKALPKSKHPLLEGIQQLTRGTEQPISAKFEIEDGHFSLSVYTAGKGLAVDAERNVLQEYAGAPDASAWEPKVEVFDDDAHIARSAQQLTLMALAPVSLADVVEKAEKSQAGTVYSVTPVLRGRKAQFVVLLAKDGRSIEQDYDLLTGEAVKAKDADAPKR
jgi:hypothetical protein